MRVRSDVVSGFHHGLRPPLWLGRQAWTIPPNCLPASATDGGRISPSSQDTHYSLDFFNLISSHFVDLTSASSSGPLTPPSLLQSWPKLWPNATTRRLAMMVSRTPPSSQISRGGVACCSNFSTWSYTGTRCRRRGRSAQSFLCSNMETLQVQTSTAPSL